MGALEVRGTKCQRHLVDPHQAVGVARRRPNGDERVHVWREVREGLKPHDKVAAVDKEHAGGEKELRHRGGHHTLHAGKAGNLRPAKHGTHGQVEEGHAKDDGPDELLLLGLDRLLGALPGVDERAVRGGAACLLPRRRAIAFLLDGRDHSLRGPGVAVVVELHRVLEQVDVCLADAGHARGGLSNPCRAGRAGHARDVERLLHSAWFPSLLRPWEQGNAV